MTIYDDLIKRSEWDFNWREDMPNNFVRHVGNIEGDWEVRDISKDVCPCGPQSYKQLEEMGGSLENAWDYNLVDADKHSQLYELAEKFGLKDLFVELHVQRPGQMHPLHMDMGALGGSKDVDRSKQVVIKWKKGDAVFFDWYNVPHGTCNFGHHDRPLLSVTGTITKEFENNFLNKDVDFAFKKVYNNNNINNKEKHT